MSIRRLTESIRKYSETELCYGTVVTLTKIDRESDRLEAELVEAKAVIAELNRVFDRDCDKEERLEAENTEMLEALRAHCAVCKKTVDFESCEKCRTGLLIKKVEEIDD